MLMKSPALVIGSELMSNGAIAISVARMPVRDHQFPAGVVDRSYAGLKLLYA